MRGKVLKAANFITHPFDSQVLQGNAIFHYQSIFKDDSQPFLNPSGGMFKGDLGVSAKLDFPDSQPCCVAELQSCLWIWIFIHKPQWGTWGQGNFSIIVALEQILSGQSWAGSGCSEDCCMWKMLLLLLTSLKLQLCSKWVNCLIQSGTSGVSREKLIPSFQAQCFYLPLLSCEW